MVALVATWILGARRVARKLEPIYQQAQRQIAAGKVALAIESLRALLPLGKWMPLLSGQIHAQLGFLHHQNGDRDAAIDSLNKAGRRAGDAKLLLASFHFHKGDKAAAYALIEASLPFNRKHVLLHNAYAWLLHRDDRRADALVVLNKLLAKHQDEASSDNRLRLQNQQRMNMMAFGMLWYALGFERPPAAMGELRPARKGFRQAPKKRG